MLTNVKHILDRMIHSGNRETHATRTTQWVTLLIVGGLLLTLIISGTLVHRSLWGYNTREESDIYYHWVEGGRLLAGENPYARVLAGDMRKNDKYATLFPLIYLLSAATRRAGLNDYDSWIAFWRAILLVFNLGSITTIFLAFCRRGMILGGLCAALIVLFNRYSLHATESASIDFIPLFFLALSMVLLKRNIWLALVLLSLSLAFKHVGIILAPIYLIFIWQSFQGAQLRRTLLAAALIASIPLIISLPFLAWNAEGFVKSLLFSATRDASSSNSIFAVDVTLGLSGIPARLPLFAMLLLCYGLLIKRQVAVYTSGLLAMAVFILFNSVLFSHYMNWFVLVIVFVAWDHFDTGRTGLAHAST